MNPLATGRGVNEEREAQEARWRERKSRRLREEHLKTSLTEAAISFPPQRYWYLALGTPLRYIGSQEKFNPKRRNSKTLSYLV